MAEDFRLKVGTKVDTNTIEQQLNAKTYKVTATIVTKGGNEYEKTVTKLKTDTGQLYEATTNLNKATGESTSKLTKASTSMKDLAKNTQVASAHTETLGQKFTTIIGKVATFGLATSLIGAFTKSMYEGVESVKDMDASLTELKKVSDLSGDSLENYTDQAFTMARDLKTTASDITDAVTEFAKSNYTLEESQILAKQAIIFQTIADGAISASDSATMLIQVMKAYNMTVSDSVDIINSINEVSNKYAVSSSDLSSSVGRVASSAKMAGVDFSQLLGLITGSNEIVQNAGKVANGYKTILTNLMTKDLEKQFNEFGLSMREQNGQLKSGYDMVLDLADVYNKLGTTWSEDDEAMVSLNDTFNKLLKDIAGNYNINTLVAGFQNVETTINATESAMNSANSASDEYAVAMDSVAKKADATKGAFQELVWGDGGLNNLIKGFLDVSTILIRFASSDVGGAIIQIGLLTTAFVLLSKAVTSTVAMDLVGWIMKIPTAMAIASNSTLGLSMALEALNINPVVLGITALVAVVYGSVKAFDYFNESLSETQDKITNLNSDYESSTSSIATLTEQLDALYEQMKAINAEDGTKVAKDGELAILVSQTQELEKQLAIETERQRLSSQELEKSASKSVRTKVQDVGAFGRTNYADIGVETTNEGTRVDALKSYAQQMQSATVEINKFTKAKADLISRGITEGAEYNNISDSLNKAQSKYDNASTSALKYSDELKVETENLSETSKTRQYAQEGFDAYNNALLNSVGAIEESKDASEDANDTMFSTVDTIEELAERYSNLSSETDDIVLSIGALSSALEEQDKSGSLSLDTQLKLIDSGYAMALSYDEQTGACTLNVDAMKSLTEAKMRDQIADLQILQTDIATKLREDGIAAMESSKGFLFLASAKGANGDSAEAVKTYNEAESKINALSSALEGMKKSSTSAWTSSIRGADKASSATDKQKKALDELKDKYDTAIDVINSQLDKYIDKLEDAKDNALDAIDEQIDALEEAKDVELESIDERIDKLEKLKDVRLKAIQDEVDAYKKLSDETKSYYDKLLSDIDEQNKATEESIELQRLQDALASAKQQKVMVFEGGEFVYKTNLDAVAKAQQELDTYQLQLKAESEVKAIEDSRDAELAIYEQKVADLQLEYDAMEILYDKKIEKLESHRKQVEEEYDQQLEDLKKHREQVEEQYDAQIEYYENFKEQFKLMTEEYTNQQDMLLAEQLTGINLENANWMERLSNLSSFIEKYNALMSKMKTAPTASSSTPSSSSSGSGTSATKSSSSGTSANGLLVGDSLGGSSKINGANGLGLSSSILTPLGSSFNNIINDAKYAVSHNSNSSSSNIVNNINMTLPNVTDGNSFVKELKSFNFKQAMIQGAYNR